MSPSQVAEFLEQRRWDEMAEELRWAMLRGMILPTLPWYARVWERIHELFWEARYKV